MTRRFMIPVAVMAVMVAGTMGDVPSALRATAGTAIASSRGASVDAADALQQKGRYKKGGDETCVWDANDSGPDQCTPQTKGRFKKGGDDSCTWDENDRGPDQCTPPKGRWKKEGNGCRFDPKDGGPNQCNPRQPRK
jgi:hypothetical protein